jgi:predicted membrane-bound dolichyl-phosphate-mannose-protein mannosyltransferase
MRTYDTKLGKDFTNDCLRRTQADKIHESIAGMNELLNTFPVFQKKTLKLPKEYEKKELSKLRESRKIIIRDEGKYKDLTTLCHVENCP